MPDNIRSDAFTALPFKGRLPVLEKTPRPGLAPVVPQLPEGFLEQIGDVEPAVGLEQLVKGAAAVEVRLSRCDSSVYFWPLMTLRSLPRSRTYSLFLTWSKASPRWRITWNLSNRMLACAACLRVELRKGFHMSITASRTRLHFAAPSHCNRAAAQMSAPRIRKG